MARREIPPNCPHLRAQTRPKFGIKVVVNLEATDFALLVPRPFSRRDAMTYVTYDLARKKAAAVKLE